MMKDIKKMKTKELEKLLMENCPKYEEKCSCCPYTEYCEEYAHRKLHEKF